MTHKKHVLTEDAPHKEVLMIIRNLPYIVDIPIPKDEKDLTRLVNLTRTRVFYQLLYKVEHPKKRGRKPKQTVLSV